MGRRFSGPRLITGRMDCNGVVHVSGPHHQHHLDERAPEERANDNSDSVMALEVGAPRLNYMQSTGGDDAPAAAAYACSAPEYELATDF